MRVFLDANILFSAVYADASTATRLFGSQEVGLCQLTTSAYAFDEARRNILAKRPKQLALLESFVEQLVFTAEPSPALIAKAVQSGVPAKDAPILAAAIAGHANVLVTGDRAHFGHLYETEVEGVRVMRLADVFVLLTG